MGAQKISFPIPTSKLWDYLPHRPPMVWVDEVVSVSPTSSECRVFLDRSQHYFGSNGVRPTSCIEWIAQAYAFGSIARALSSGCGTISGVTRAFLVGVNDFTVESQDRFPQSGSLLIRVETRRELMPVVVFAGSVWTETGSELARASIKVFASGSG